MVDEHGRYIKVINLGSWSCAPYDYSIDTLVENEEFVNALIEKVTEEISNSVNLSRFIQTIAIRLGSKGNLIVIPTEKDGELIECKTSCIMMISKR